MGGLPTQEAAAAVASALTDRDALRFWSKVGQPDGNGCRLWTASALRTGYGAFMVRGRVRSAHRVAYELARGAIPQGLFVCHRCDVRRCCNPEHLFLGTPGDNMADMIAKGRKVQKRGVEAGGARLDERVVRAIRDSDLGPRALGRLLGVSHTTIMSVRKRRLWAHVA